MGLWAPQTFLFKGGRVVKAGEFRKPTVLGGWETSGKGVGGSLPAGRSSLSPSSPQCMPRLSAVHPLVASFRLLACFIAFSFGKLLFVLVHILWGPSWFLLARRRAAGALERWFSVRAGCVLINPHASTAYVGRQYLCVGLGLVIALHFALC